VTVDRRCDDLLVGLSPAQRAAVVTEAAPLCILASAGAGKTRVLTRRIAFRTSVGSASPRHTLALTFTRKAAAELQHRLTQLGIREHVVAGTFHSIASAQLRRWWTDTGRTVPEFLDRKSRLLSALVGSRPGLRTAPLAELAGHLEWAKARMISPERFEETVTAAGRSLPGSVSAAGLAGLYARYEHEKRRRGLIDFDDLLLGCAQAIEQDPDFAAAQRWRWRHLFVDEFQDVNPLQHRLLLAWLGASTDMCVVGDLHQAIYGWNGADADLLAQVPKRWPSTEVIRLDANHRSTEQIVEAAAGVLGTAGVHLRATGRQGPPPRLTAYPTERAEARGIASAVQRAGAAGRSWGELAVLTRTNAQLDPIQKALAAAGIPFWAPTRSAVLEDPLARRVIQRLRGRPDVPLRTVIADLQELAADLSGGAAAESPPPDDASRAALTVLGELAVSYLAQEPESPAGQWLAWLPTAVRDSSEETGRSDRVTLCSFHRAKGLEWESVWIAGLERGFVPIGRTSCPEEEAEERRLLYVAVTRATTELHCSWSRQRTFGTRPVPRDPSPWLELLAPASATGSPAVQPDAVTTWRKRLAEQRRGLRRVAASDRSKIRPGLPAEWPTADPALVSSLRAWRLETARATGVPAYVVLHDVTIEALASLRPRTPVELLAVPGLGPVKAARFGPSLLSIVAEQAASA
jgi:DNA helicase-2/ATP-dependent DNA helicase PcrA